MTQLAFGAQFGFIRIAAGDQQVSVWQHFICWWATVAAASGEFETERDHDASVGHDFSNDAPEQHRVGAVLETFIKNGADPTADAQNHCSRAGRS